LPEAIVDPDTVWITVHAAEQFCHRADVFGTLEDARSQLQWMMYLRGYISDRKPRWTGLHLDTPADAYLVIDDWIVGVLRHNDPRHQEAWSLRTVVTRNEITFQEALDHGYASGTGWEPSYIKVVIPGQTPDAGLTADEPAEPAGQASDNPTNVRSADSSSFTRFSARWAPPTASHTPRSDWTRPEAVDDQPPRQRPRETPTWPRSYRVHSASWRGALRTPRAMLLIATLAAVAFCAAIAGERTDPLAAIYVYSAAGACVLCLPQLALSGSWKAVGAGALTAAVFALAGTALPAASNSATGAYIAVALWMTSWVPMLLEVLRPRAARWLTPLWLIASPLAIALLAVSAL